MFFLLLVYDFRCCFRSVLGFSLLVCFWTSYARSCLLSCGFALLEFVFRGTYHVRVVAFVYWRLACCMWFAFPKHRDCAISHVFSRGCMSYPVSHELVWVMKIVITASDVFNVTCWLCYRSLNHDAFLFARLFLKLVWLSFDFINAFASLPDLCHVLIVQLGVV